VANGYEHITISSLSNDSDTLLEPDFEMGAYNGLPYVCAHTGETLIFDPAHAVVTDGRMRLVVRRGQDDSRCSVVRLRGLFRYPLETEAATTDERAESRPSGEHSELE
jgi:hypothetical protein